MYMGEQKFGRHFVALLSIVKDVSNLQLKISLKPEGENEIMKTLMYIHILAYASLMHMHAQYTFSSLAAPWVLTRLTWSVAVQMRYLLSRPLTTLFMYSMRYSPGIPPTTDV